MHSLEIYSIRTFDKALPGPFEERYAKMGSIRKYSLIDLISASCDSFDGKLMDYSELALALNPNADKAELASRSFTIGVQEKDENNIHGLIKMGEYGTKNPILDRLSGKLKGHVEVDDSVMKDHYFYVQMRPDERQALLFLQSISGKGVKTIFEKVIRKVFKKKTGGLTCQIRPLTNKAVLKEWQENATVCEIRLSRFAQNLPFSDKTDKLGETYTEVTIKPKKRNARLGKLAEIDGGLIDVYSEYAGDVQVQVEYNGRKRLFTLGSSENLISTVEIDPKDESIKYVDGNPTYSSMKKYAVNLASDMWE